MNETNNTEIPRVQGTWNGRPVNIKKVWSSHEFTDEELASLFADEIIEFEAVSKKGELYPVKGTRRTRI